jgi:hypothetical protein
MRVGRLEFYALLDMWQTHMLRPMLLRRAWARVQAAGGVPGITCEWSFPKRPWVDPEAEINAEIKAIRAGLLSQPDALAARGDDWRELLAEQAQFLAEADRLDLVLDTDPRAIGASGNAQPVTPAPATGASDDGAGDASDSSADRGGVSVQVALSDDMGRALRAELAPAMASAEAAAEAARAATAGNAEALRELRATADEMALAMGDSRAALAGTAEQIAAAAASVAAAAERAAQRRSAEVVRDAQGLVTRVEYR